MTATQGTREVGRGGVRARIDDIRRALAVTTDAPIRSRLRVRLADALSALGDLPSAVGELKQAAAEAPGSAGLALAVKALAPRLASAEAEALRVAVRGGRPARQAVARRKSPAGARESSSSSSSSSSRSSSSRGDGAAASPPAPLPAPSPAPLPALSSLSESAALDARVDPIDTAFAALGEGKPLRARRLGEEAARLGDMTALRAGRLRDLVRALDQQGAKRESLRLARTLAEPDGGVGASHDTLEAIVNRARQAGDLELARRWQADLGPTPAREPRVDPASRDDADASIRARFRAAQRAALLATDGKNSEAVIARLMPLLSGHPVGPAALAMAERLAGSLGDRAASCRAELLSLAFDGERVPNRRQALAVRLADSLNSAGDSAGALAALGRAIDELPDDRAGALRRARADLLRIPGREAELCRVLEADAEVSDGAARRALRGEQASVLDRLGEFDSALEVRLGALAEAPGELGLLAAARQRLEAVGRMDRSLELATAAVPHVQDRAARAGLLRDVATLAEVAAGDPQRAAAAWLEVVALYPDDAAAGDASERLLRQTNARIRLGELLAWSAARQVDPEARAVVLWRLAEFRRVEQQSPLTALTLYREIIAARGGASEALAFKEDDWQRRDDALAMHTARALAAPTAFARAQAISDRAAVLIDAGRLDEADRDLSRALDLDPGISDGVRTLERLYERRGDWRGLRYRLSARVEGTPGAAAAQLWFGIARANERLGDPPAARSAYERALAADDGFRPAVTALRQLAFARNDFTEVGRLLEKELELGPTQLERVGLLIELGVLLTEKLDRSARAVEVLDSALAFEPANPGALEAMFGAALAAGNWEKATQALDAMLAAGIAVADAGQRYHRLGLAAEKAEQVDRALGLYSRSYARNPAFRPTLERLSEICFERQQWENAWKATEHLIERHGTDLDANTRAEMALRSALADLHVAQRLVAVNLVGGMMAGRLQPGGLRDVADSWASMRFDPQLLGRVDSDRRARVLSRLSEVLALTDEDPQQPARSTARETLAALAVVDRRWADALSLLDGLGNDRTLGAGRRCLFLVTAGDILLHQQGDAAGAALRYRRARTLNPHEPRLARAGIVEGARDDVAARQDERKT